MSEGFEPREGESFDLWQICDSSGTEPHSTLGEVSNKTDKPKLNEGDIWVSHAIASNPGDSGGTALESSPLKGATFASRTSLGVLAVIERLVTLVPAGNGGSVEELESWLTRLLIVVRIAMVSFPFFALLAYWHNYAHPDLVALAVGIAVLQSGVEVVLLRRGCRLGGRVLVPVDLTMSMLVAAIALIGAGRTGRFHGLDGFLPYLMIIAGLAGVGFGLSWRGLVITAVAALTWALLPLGRGALVWNDEGGFLLWLAAGALVAATLRLFASRLDQAVVERITAEKVAEQARQEHWIHEDLLGLCQRLAEGKIAPGDRRRARRIVTQVRLGVLGDTRPHPYLAAGLPDLVAEAQELGIKLKLMSLLEADPPVLVSERLLALLEALIGNVARHAEVSSAELVVRTSSALCYASLSDSGVGFDPFSTAWSSHTKRLVIDARDIGLCVSVQAGASGSLWEMSWQA